MNRFVPFFINSNYLAAEWNLKVCAYSLYIYIYITIIVIIVIVIVIIITVIIIIFILYNHHPFKATFQAGPYQNVSYIFWGPPLKCRIGC